MFRFAVRVTHSTGQSVEHVYARNLHEACSRVNRTMASRNVDGYTVGPIKSKPTGAYKEGVNNV
jgi:hypothetical protein